MISRPITGSAQCQPTAEPAAPSSTASDVNPSVRASSPSATSAAEPIRRPTTMRYRATTSLPRKPSTAASATALTCAIGTGWASRRTAAYPASADDAVIASTMTIPARSSARPYP